MAKKTFALLGVGGFIASKHLQAIKEVGGELVAALDPKDSVGILDSYFPDCEFFTEFERFDRHLSDKKIDYLVVCTPNYLHDSHIRFGLRIGADVICEKPLVINSKNLDKLEEAEKKSGNKVYCVLQLRYHPVVKKLRGSGDFHKVHINYFTPRGNWYKYSWKMDEKKSGGLAMNIGVHLFDMLIWLFGHPSKIKVTKYTDDTVSGEMDLCTANVKFTLSIDKNLEPKREIIIDGDKIDFTTGFKDLHTEVYKNILNGNGYGIEDCYPSIELIERIKKCHLNT